MQQLTVSWCTQNDDELSVAGLWRNAWTWKSLGGASALQRCFSHSVAAVAIASNPGSFFRASRMREPEMRSVCWSCLCELCLSIVFS